jgi:DNA recombination protein RmuC
MDTLPLVLQLLTLGLAVVAAAAALLILFRTGRKGENSENIMAAVRTEADRLQLHAENQSRGLRQEVTEGLRGFQTATEAKLDATDARLAASARDLREALTGSFTQTTELLTGNLTGLGVHQKERLDALLAELKALTEKHAQTQETLRQTVEGRLDALRIENSAKLDEMRKTVDEKLQTELEKRLGESFRTVTEQLERVHAGLGEMQTLATGVGDLKKVLTNVKTRGIWGEVQLGMLLEQFLSPDQYIANAQCKPNSAERVEYAVRFSSRDIEGDLLLPIDAKFPQEDYQRLIDASERSDVEAVALASAALEARVKSFAKTICEKYINPPITTDYAILFLPTEGLFAEVLRRPGLQEQLQQQRVMLAGPTTLSSLLSAFQLGFRSLAIQERSSEVWKILGAVRQEFAKHGAVVEKLKNQLDTASRTIERLGTRTTAMNRKLRDVEILPVGNAQTLLGLPDAALPEDEEDEGEA